MYILPIYRRNIVEQHNLKPYHKLHTTIYKHIQPIRPINPVQSYATLYYNLKQYYNI